MFHYHTDTLRSKESFLYSMFYSAISLTLVVGTSMDGTTPVYNEKNILGVPSGFTFIEYPLNPVYENLIISNLVSDGKKIFPPFLLKCGPAMYYELTFKFSIMVTFFVLNVSFRKKTKMD